MENLTKTGLSKRQKLEWKYKWEIIFEQLGLQLCVWDRETGTEIYIYYADIGMTSNPRL